MTDELRAKAKAQASWLRDNCECEGVGGCPDCETAALLTALLDGIETLEATLREERSFVWRWIERAIYDDQIPASDALATLAHSPFAPWSTGRWEVDHKPYAARLYADHPRASTTLSGEKV